MIQLLTQNITRFFLLILLQIFIMNDINLGVFFNIYVYVLFIILFPVDIPGWILLPLCFITGLIIDTSLNTAGLHASACTFTGFLRPVLLRILKPREGYELNLTPGLFNMGWKWFVSYVSLVLFIHHVWLFTLETFRFSDVFFILIKVIAGLILNLFLILLIQLLTSSYNRNR